MNSQSNQMLLAPDEPAPAKVFNPAGQSPFLLIGDHTGNFIPSSLGSLGLDAAERTRHIAWDIGVAGLGEALAGVLDATFIHQVYSRLVIDANRDPSRTDAMPMVSDGTIIPANQQLTATDRHARVAAIHSPYHATIANELARRDSLGHDTILVSLHSFTPTMAGVDRPWQIGLLHSAGNLAFTRCLLRLLQASTDLCVGDNQPYAMNEIDYTIPRHAFAANRRYAEIEIRQDLLQSAPQQLEWSRRLAALLETCRTGTDVA